MSTRIGRGLAAGLIAAAAFAVFFLLVDVVSGQPFRTPAYMSGVIFSSTTALPATARVIVFTILHFLAFGIIGIIVAWLLDKLDVPPTLYLGGLLGFLLFDIVFYGSVLGLGVDIVRALGWPAVLAGNIIAGIVLFGYLKARSGVAVMPVRDELRNHDTLRRGLIAGLIGAVVVGVWFLIIDFAKGHIFYTPAALGSALFFGANQPDDVVFGAGVVIAYTIAHFVLFFLAGLGAAWLMEEADKNPPMLIGMVLFFVTLEVLSLGILSAVASWLFEIVPWWSPIVANLLAAAAMVAFLWREHPDLRTRMGGARLEDEASGIRPA